MTEDLLALTSDIVTAHVGNNAVSIAELPDLIRSTYEALRKTGEPASTAPALKEPAVSIRASIKPDHLVCLEDGKKLTMLKRYLRTTYDMSPDEYRAKWKLPRDYPMVAPNYAEKRRGLALASGLGQGEGCPGGGRGLGRGRSAGHRIRRRGDGQAGRRRAVEAGPKRLGIAAAKAAAAAHLGGAPTQTPVTKPRKPRATKAG